MTAGLSQMLAAVGFAHLMSPPVWSRALTQPSVTGPSKSLDPDSGTICRLHCVSPTRVGQFKKLLKTHYGRTLSDASMLYFADVFFIFFLMAALVGQTGERIFTKLSHVVDIRLFANVLDQFIPGPP